MSLTDIPIRAETITDKANRIREILASLVNIADSRLQQIRDLVSKYGRAAIAAEFGDDAAALLVVYTKFKEAIEAAKEIQVEDLPNG